MPVDPQVKEMLDLFAVEPLPTLREQGPEEARRFMRLTAPSLGIRAEAYASPLRAADFSRLPPALVVTAEHDPLCDEGEAYARRLEAAGNRVRQIRYDGMIHGFLRRTRALDRARACIRELGDILRQDLGR